VIKKRVSMLLFEIESDWKANRQFKIKLLLLLFRIAKFGCNSELLLVRLISIPIKISYLVYSHFICAIELPVDTEVGCPLIIWHGVGLVVNSNAKLGSYIVLRNGVVIGNNGVSESAPVVGDNVEFGVNSVIIGKIIVGDYCLVGPNVTLTTSVCANSKILPSRPVIEPRKSPTKI